MMRKIILFILYSLPAYVFAQERPFVYEDHGKRDPFNPMVNSSGAITIYDDSLSIVDLNLEGIVTDPQGKNVAIVNGKIIKKGDVIGPYTVEVINDNEVVLIKDQQNFSLKLKKGGL